MGVGVLVTRARLLGREVDPLTPVVRGPTPRAENAANLESCTPGQRGRPRLVAPEVSGLGPAQRPPQQDAQLVRERPDRLWPRRLLVAPWHALVVWPPRLHGARPVRGHPGGAPPLVTLLFQPPASPTLAPASAREVPGYRPAWGRASAGLPWLWSAPAPTAWRVQPRGETFGHTRAHTVMARPWGAGSLWSHHPGLRRRVPVATPVADRGCGVA